MVPGVLVLYRFDCITSFANIGGNDKVESLFNNHEEIFSNKWYTCIPFHSILNLQVGYSEDSSKTPGKYPKQNS